MGVGKEKEENNTCTPLQYQNAPASPQITQADSINKMCLGIWPGVTILDSGKIVIPVFGTDLQYVSPHKRKANVLTR